MYKTLDVTYNNYFSFIDNIPDAIVVADSKGKIVLINPQTVKMFGYSQEELLGEPVEKLIPERSHGSHTKHHKNYAKKSAKSAMRPMGTGISIVGKRKDGNEIPLDISLAPWRNGDEVLVISFIRDITERIRAENRLRKSKELEILYKVTGAVHKSHELEEIYNIALDMAIELDNVDIAFIYLVDKARKKAVLQAHRNLPDDYIRNASVIPFPKGGTWKVIATGKTFSVENMQTESDIGPAGRNLGHHGALGIPIAFENEVMGVIWFLSYKERRFDEDEVRLLTSIGDQIGTAIAKAKMYSDMSRKNRYEEIIRTVTQDVHRSIDLGEVLANAAESLSKNIQFAGKIGIYMVEGKEVVLKAQMGLTDSFVKQAGRIPCPKGFTWKTIIEGKPRYCPDTDTDEYMGPAGRKEGIKSYLSMPITFESRTVGCININSQQKNAFDEEELRLLETVSNQISIAIKNAQQAEELLLTQFTFDRSGEAIMWVDPDGKFVYVNDAACKLHGYTREELLSMHVYDVDLDITKEVWPEIWKGFKQMSTQAFESRGHTKECRIFPVEVTAKYLDYKGKEYVCAYVRDITGRKHMERELLKAEKLESVGTLAGGIAHDFNNLLSVIIGNVSLARLHLEKRSKEYINLDLAVKAAYRAADIANQLLTFSKGGEPVKELTSIGELIKESAGFASTGTNVKCEYSIPPDLWSAEVDKGQISQVINNLVINAQQAMPEGGILQLGAENTTVGIGHPTLKDGDYIRITIKDSGIGIPEENLHKVFDPYFTTKENGTGLGLATSYSIISKHGGSITVDSNPGVGTTFTIYIPASGGEFRTNEAGEDFVEGGRGKILIMDDEEMLKTIVGLILEDIGYKARFAGNGEEVLEQYTEALAEGEPFSAVILDLTVPGGMGGKETIKKLIEIDPNVTAIVSSGYSNDPVIAEFERYGFKGFIRKPYSTEDLSHVLHEVIHH